MTEQTVLSPGHQKVRIKEKEFGLSVPGLSHNIWSPWLVKEMEAGGLVLVRTNDHFS